MKTSPGLYSVLIKRRFAFIVLVLSRFTSDLVAAQPVVAWSVDVTVDSNSLISGLAVDNTGNVYVTGDTFDALAGLSVGLRDGFVAKYDGSGERSWIRQFGTTASDRISGRPALASGRVIVGGSTSGSFQSANAGSVDAFIHAYSESGDVEWVRQFGTTSIDSVNDLSTDRSGNVYFAAQTDGAIEGSFGGSRDGVVGKYDLAGNSLWTRQFGDAGFDVPRSIATANDGTSLLAGFTGGSRSAQDILLASYDADGTEVWSTQYGSNEMDQAISVAVDHLGHFFVAGVTEGVLGSTSGGSGDAFLAKYDSSGNRVFTRQYGGTLNERGFSVATDRFGNAYVVGDILDNPTGGPVRDSDGFLVKYDSSGDLMWEYKLTGSLIENIAAVTVDDFGSVYVSGTRAVIPGSSLRDIFLTKISQVPELSASLLAALALCYACSLSRTW